MLEEKQADLAERHRTEALFHDRKWAVRYSGPRHYGAHPTYPIFQRMMALLGEDLAGKRILEYGCGLGWITKEIARRGAQVFAFDISAEAVAKTRKSLEAANLLDRCTVEVMGGEDLHYPDDSFDLVVGFAILHHLDQERALTELRRVLKPGGRALFAEPLASNPVINLYRRLTPQYRTPDEAPLDLDVFSKQLRGFRRFEHHDQLLLASAAMALCYLPGLAGLAPPTQRWLMRVDDAIMRVAPRVGRWAWYSILVLQK
ncbi:MAG: methyltransferase domain-containing protein [Luteitalea sp.]|nr:methyltransferase domain-containing protein [Luteitalea sp.]